MLQNAYYFYYDHKEGAPNAGNSGKAFQESWFLSKNLKNEKKWAGEEGKENGTYIYMWERPGDLRSLEGGLRNSVKKGVLLIFSVKKLSLTAERFHAQRDTALSKKVSHSTKLGPSSYINVFLLRIWIVCSSSVKTRTYQRLCWQKPKQMNKNNEQSVTALTGGSSWTNREVEWFFKSS